MLRLRFKNYDNLVFYDGEIPYLNIIKILRKYEEKQLMEEIAKLRDIKILLEGSVINLEEIARRYGVSVEALKKVININSDYLLLGDQLISDQTLKTIRNELNGVKKHSEAVKILEKYGIKSQQIFEILGYKVKWSGLDPENAEILKIA